MCQEAPDLERSNIEERTKSKCRKDKDHDLRYVTGPQGWAANSTPGIYQWHLPVFTGLENTPQVANTGKYWQIEIFLALKNCRSL